MLKGYLLAGAVTGTFIAGIAGAEVPVALQEARRHMLDASVNTLTFHNMDELFDTRRVDNGGTKWELPRAETKLDFTYAYGGETRPAEAALERTFTNALIIVKQGRIVSEIYRNKTGTATHFISFSMAKSITSTLIGIAIADGHIRSVNDPITKYVPELEHTAYEGVTLKQALMMRSGANYEERFDFERPGLAAAAFQDSLVSNKYRFASFAKVLTRAHAPGEQFTYSTVETAVLGWVLERATKQSITQYMTERLWKPAGMESYGFWILDGEPEVGREFNGAGFNAVARDYARFGLLMLRNGKAQGKQVVPAAWVKESTVATADASAGPAGPGGPGRYLGYKYQWWTLPDSQAYSAIGLQGQFIFIDPATDTVVVKLSYFPPGNEQAGEETLEFLRAASAWNPR
jgi:CubicO group peptidase (beta-lactamase class C family)